MQFVEKTNCKASVSGYVYALENFVQGWLVNMILGSFVEIGGDKIIVAHYIPREKTFVTKEVKDKLHTVEVAKDQVSMTYYHPRHKLLGIACANG